MLVLFEKTLDAERAFDHPCDSDVVEIRFHIPTFPKNTVGKFSVGLISGPSGTVWQVYDFFYLFAFGVRCKNENTVIVLKLP